MESQDSTAATLACSVQQIMEQQGHIEQQAVKKEEEEATTTTTLNSRVKPEEELKETSEKEYKNDKEDNHHQIPVNNEAELKLEEESVENFNQIKLPQNDLTEKDDLLDSPMLKNLLPPDDISSSDKQEFAIKVRNANDEMDNEKLSPLIEAAEVADSGSHLMAPKVVVPAKVLYASEVVSSCEKLFAKEEEEVKEDCIPTFSSILPTSKVLTAATKIRSIPTINEPTGAKVVKSESSRLFGIVLQGCDDQLYGAELDDQELLKATPCSLIREPAYPGLPVGGGSPLFKVAEVGLLVRREPLETSEPTRFELLTTEVVTQEVDQEIELEIKTDDDDDDANDGDEKQEEEQKELKGEEEEERKLPTGAKQRISISIEVAASASAGDEQPFGFLNFDPTQLNVLMTPNSDDDGDEDLEWEFDNEPTFEMRNVQVKRNCDPRDEYELGDELGRGRFGTVYRCIEQSSGQKLAAKFVFMRRREDREDVEREVAIMSKLQHKRLLQLYDAFDDGQNEMCLITELVEGGELFERIIDDDFELTEKKAAIFMRQICEGVEYMQSQQIVHLDMKPENILCISKTGNRIKLIDFGLARQLKPNEPLRIMFGTPDFAAPEVLAYDLVSLATDMWSVGVICYVLLSGLSPFMGDNDMDTMANVTRATYDFEDQAFEPISDLAKDFISKLLVREPSKRLKPNECLKHAWLQRGGEQLVQAVRVRRESIAILNQNITPPLIATAAASSVAIGGIESRRSSLLLGSTTPPLTIFSLDKRNLKKYVVRRKWHKTVHAIMALGRMGANLKFQI